MTRRIISKSRERRHKRIRSKVFGMDNRPRLAIFRSNKYLYAQIINDEKSKTLMSIDTREIKSGTPLKKANEAGKKLAEKALGKGVKEVVFDRGGFLYKGKIRSFAEGARVGGLEF